MVDPVLSLAERAFVTGARRAVLATLAPDGRPRLVPICFVLDGGGPTLYTPLDQKPKRSNEQARLARVRDLQADPRVSVLVDRWDEDWSRLAWVRCHGSASLLQPGAAHAELAAEHAAAVTILRAKYPHYATHRLETRPVIRIAIEQTSSWGALDPP